MAWEELPSNSSGGGAFSPIGNEEVSIVTSKVRDSLVYRINIPRIAFPEGTKMIVIKLDKEKKRIGFFPADEKNDRRLNGYGKNSRLIYVSIPRIIKEMGFDKGRYKITKSDKLKEKYGLYFYVDAEDKTGSFPTAEELKAKQQAALAAKDGDKKD